MDNGSSIPKVVTLTTDLGDGDYYVSALKGTILNADPSIQIVDISHKIRKFDIVHAAFVLKNAYSYFPPNSLHFSNVGPPQQWEENFIVFNWENHYFVGPNNGLLSLIFNEFVPDQIYQLEKPEYYLFPQAGFLEQVISFLKSERPLHEIGFPIKNLVLSSA